MHPVVAGIFAKDWTRLKTNHCFAATPWVARLCERISGGNKRIVAVTSDTADTPDCAAVGAGGRGRSPCCYGGWIVYRHPHQPAMIGTAISHAPITNIKNVTHDAEGRSLLLDLRSEVDPVVGGCRLHVHGPAGIDVARVNVKG